MRKTTKCPYNIPFHRRHCLLAEFMKMLNENDFLYVIDSDVIAHNYEGKFFIMSTEFDKKHFRLKL